MKRLGKVYAGGRGLEASVHLATKQISDTRHTRVTRPAEAPLALSPIRWNALTPFY